MTSSSASPASRVLVFLLGLDDGGDGAPCDPNVDPVGDLDDEVVVVLDLHDDAVDPAHGENLVPRVDLGQHLLLQHAASFSAGG